MRKKRPRIFVRHFDPIAFPHLTLSLSGALLCVLLIAVYANGVSGAFQFDDYNVIVDNAAVHSWSVWWQTQPSIRPLLKLSYTLNWMLAPTPLGFHVVNIAVHVLASLLVLQFASALFAESRDAIFAALLAAMLFALHPAQTEAVTYICGRSTGLMAMFYLAALCAGCSERCALRAGLAPLLFIAALACKETAWTLPFALLLVNAFRGLVWRDNLRRTAPLLLALLLGAMLIMATPAYRRMLLHSVSIRPLLENLVVQVDGWFYLLMQVLLQLRINIDPDLATQPNIDPWWFARAALLALLIVIAWRLRREWSGFALCWLFLHLLPTNSLLPRNDIANDRQLYLALIGPALWCAHIYIGARQQRSSIAAAFVLVVLFALTTQLRNRDYRDEISLWLATAKFSPHKARVWNNLGYAYQQRGFAQAAVSAYRQALLLNPNYDRARINLLLLDSSPLEIQRGLPPN